MNVFSGWRRQTPEPTPPTSDAGSYVTVVHALDQLCRGAVRSGSFLPAVDALSEWEILGRDPQATIAAHRASRAGILVTGPDAHVIVAGSAAMNLYFLAFDLWIGRRGFDRSDLVTRNDKMEQRVTHFANCDLVFEFTEQPPVRVVPGEVWSGGAIRIWAEAKRT